MSQVKQNFHPNNEANINKLINLKLTASYVYLSLVCSHTYITFMYLHLHKLKQNVISMLNVF